MDDQHPRDDEPDPRTEPDAGPASGGRPSSLGASEQAQNAAREVTLQGRRVMFVCTKRQLRAIVEQEAERCGAHFVTERWLGGMLTNFQTIKKQIRRMKELQRGIEEGSYEFYTKKERLLLDRERAKLDKYLSGVKDMSRLPGAVFVVDAKREIIAVREATARAIDSRPPYDSASVSVMPRLAAETARNYFEIRGLQQRLATEGFRLRRVREDQIGRRLGTDGRS